MPIYEFYCPDCHTIFNFFSSSVNTEKRPSCPRCKKKRLSRRMSVFATSRHRGEEDDAPLPDMDETKMAKAMEALSGDMGSLDENDPRQAANLMRKITDMTGMNLGPAMEEAMRRMEAGEDPDEIEAQMGDLLEGEDPFALKEKAGKRLRSLPPKKDDTLYEL